MTNEIAKRDWQELDLATPADMAGVMVQSGYFTDARSMSQAIVKIKAGRDLGLSSFASMNGIDVVEGHLRLRSSLLATLVKQSPKYTYRVREWTAEGCCIEFFELNTIGDKESLGFGEFTEADRERGGLSLKTKKGYPSVWGKYPKAMFFARAMSNGVAAHCPDVTGGTRVYTEGDDFGNGTGFELPPVDPTRTDALNAALEDDPLPGAGDEPEGEDGEAGPPKDASPASEEMSEEAKEFFNES